MVVSNPVVWEMASATELPVVGSKVIVAEEPSMMEVVVIASKVVVSEDSSVLVFTVVTVDSVAVSKDVVVPSSGTKVIPCQSLVRKSQRMVNSTHQKI